MTTKNELLETEVSWEGEDGSTHFMTVGGMIEDMKRIYDDWPGGLDELEASQTGLRRELSRFKQIAGKMYCKQ